MFEIIPNWHPVFVHFTVALLVVGAALLVACRFVPNRLRAQWETAGRWNLWLGVGFAIVTALSGLYAYNTVNHDTPSHLAMTEHRNWALVTVAVFLILGLWSVIQTRKSRAAGWPFPALLLGGVLLLGSTAWHGGELVYRYGLGVMSLPQAESHGDGHHHSHGAAASEEGPHHEDCPHHEKQSMDFSGMEEALEGHHHGNHER